MDPAAVLAAAERIISPNAPPSFAFLQGVFSGDVTSFCLGGQWWKLVPLDRPIGLCTHEWVPDPSFPA
jgi:hypothetical protein